MSAKAVFASTIVVAWVAGVGFGLERFAAGGNLDVEADPEVCFCAIYAFTPWAGALDRAAEPGREPCLATLGIEDLVPVVVVPEAADVEAAAVPLAGLFRAEPGRVLVLVDVETGFRAPVDGGRIMLKLKLFKS